MLGFLTLLAGFGLLLSPWALLALPAAVVVAFAFAAVGMAATSFMRSWQDFDLVTLVILPMFLFSTTFYPLTVYPRWLQVVVECLPLYHAVELMRGLTTGVVGLGMLGHLAYFAVMIAVGVTVGRAPPRRSPAELTRCGEAGVAGPLGGVDDGRMSVLSQRSARLDIVRSAVVAVLAILQIVVAAMAGGSVAAVANTLRTPVLAANWAFAIWAPIYLGFLLYAGYQLLPAQRGREVHRRTGWWTAASAVLNPAWILAFSGRVILLAELLLVALLIVLAVVFGRLSREPAADRIERAAFRGPIALYTGWVSMATVLGTAATGLWAGLPGANALAAIAAVVVLLAASGIVAWVVLSGTAVVPYTVAVVWALIGIALNAPPAAVVVTCAIVIVVVLASALRRVTTAGSRVRAAWG